MGRLSFWPAATRVGTTGNLDLGGLAGEPSVFDVLASTLPPEDLLALRATSTQLRASVRSFHLERQALDELHRLARRFVQPDELKRITVHPKLQWLVEEGAPATACLLSIRLSASEARAACAARDLPLHVGMCSTVGFRIADISPQADGFAGLAVDREGQHEHWSIGARQEARLQLPPDHTLVPWSLRPRAVPTSDVPPTLFVMNGQGRVRLFDPVAHTLADLPGKPDQPASEPTRWMGRSCNSRYVTHLEPLPEHGGTVITLYDLQKATRERCVFAGPVDRRPVVTDKGAVIVASNKVVSEVGSDARMNVLFDASGGFLVSVSLEGRFVLHRPSGSNELWVWDTDTQRDICLPGAIHRIESLALSPLNAMLALVDTHKRVLVYDLWGVDEHDAPLIAQAQLEAPCRHSQVIFSNTGQVDVLSLVEDAGPAEPLIRVQAHSLRIERPMSRTWCWLL